MKNFNNFLKEEEEKAAVHHIANGTHVSWHYRTAIGHGVIVGVHKAGKTSADTLYSIRQSDHHISAKGVHEPAIVYHYGHALTVEG